ncbi:NAD(P)H-dependent oxidoreductase [Shewanella colwelliana]|uniref:NAD(P)H-dependent oxidoreductase n=1 Tax=Shewanella colwelliana TaxID=23 RepID=UPI00048B8F3C|nr:NAD(P)H-dependent oxidoreductase [Shewanella colwelliana]
MSEIKKRILLLLAHPSQHRSEVNIPLFETAKAIEGVTAVDLYGEYPTFDIDIEQEQQRLVDHDIIIFQFPLYWYSTPAMLKEWQDLVLEYGFAYGTDGEQLKGKPFLCALTAGGKEEAYQAQGYNHFTIRQLLAPLEQTASLTGMHYLPPLALFGARTASEDDRMDAHRRKWRRLLKALVEDRVDLDMASGLGKLNHSLDQIILGD